jgi:hypothetical protein
MTIAQDALMQRSETYKGFIMIWFDPPATSAHWIINIGTDDRKLFAKLGRRRVIDTPTLEEALEKAKRFIDSL